MTLRHSSELSIVISLLCVPEFSSRTEQGGWGWRQQGQKEASSLREKTEYGSNTEKWPLALLLLLYSTSELPPNLQTPSFEKSVQIWETDAVVNCIQNYQA